jgi:hypothetical protein
MCNGRRFEARPSAFAACGAARGGHHRVVAMDDAPEMVTAHADPDPGPLTPRSPIWLRDPGSGRLTDPRLRREVVDRDLGTLFLGGSLRSR